LGGPPLISTTRSQRFSGPRNRLRRFTRRARTPRQRSNQFLLRFWRVCDTVEGTFFVPARSGAFARLPFPECVREPASKISNKYGLQRTGTQRSPMPNTMPTLCMDGFVSVNICDLRRAENRTVSSHSSFLKTIIYKQISTGIKQEGWKSKTGCKRGNKDYESAAAGDAERHGIHGPAACVRAGMGFPEADSGRAPDGSLRSGERFSERVLEQAAVGQPCVDYAGVAISRR